MAGFDKKILIIPLLLGGCALWWTSKSFDLGYNEGWSCQDVAGGARVKAYYFAGFDVEDPVLRIETSKSGVLTVELEIVDEIPHEGNIWFADVVVPTLKCKDRRLEGEFVTD